MGFGVMAALRIYPDRYNIAQRHIQSDEQSPALEYIFIFISLISTSPGLRNTEYRHVAKPGRCMQL